MAKKIDKQDVKADKVAELTGDLQRMRADFENYRKRTETEKLSALLAGETRAVTKLLPIIDTIERATAHLPESIADHPWVQGVSGLSKQLEKSLAELKLTRIVAKPGTVFDPTQHQAIQFDEDSHGDKEVIAEELQPGYIYDGSTLRAALVKVKRQ